MKIGSNQVVDAGKFQKRRRMKDLNMNDTWQFRIVNGPMHRHFHMWPTTEMDATTGVMKATWRGVTVERDQANALDKLAEIDKMLKAKHLERVGADPKTARSMLRKSDRFDYACIFRTQGQAPTVEVMEANWSVHDAINQIKMTKDPTKPDYLMYGLPFMYDCTLLKRHNPKTNRPDYILNVHPATLKTAGLVHVGYLDQAKNPFPNAEQFFSAEDLEVINACPFELEDLDKPISSEKVLEFLQAHPIDLGRREKNNPGIFMFFNRMEDLMALQDFARNSGVNCALPNQQDLAALGAPMPNQNQHVALPGAMGAPGQSQAVDAHYTVENNNPPPVPPPTFTPPPVPPQAAAPAVNQAPTFTPPTFAPPPQPGPAVTPFVAAGTPMAEKVPPVRPDQANNTGSPVPTFTPPPVPPVSDSAAGAPGTGSTLPPRPKDLW